MTAPSIPPNDDDAERWRQAMAQHVYNLRELDEAARELAAMRVAQNADFVRRLHNAPEAELALEFHDLIDGLLTNTRHRGRDPDSRRFTAMVALSQLLRMVWEHEAVLLAAEPESNKT